VPTSTSVKSARLLGSEGEVKASEPKPDGVELTLPAEMPVKPATVIVLEFDQPPRPISTGAGELIQVSIDGSYLLPTGAAKLHGDKLTLQPNGAIVGWADPATGAEWTIDVKSAGAFEASAALAVAAESGGEFIVVVGDQKLTIKAEPAGVPGKVRTIPLGRLSLPAGKTALTVKPAAAVEKPLMELQSIKLDPVK
jgi:hypothetical protein